jgi:hydrogenase maturation protease
MRTLIIGMGNPILADDALGVRLAHDLKAHLAHLPGVPPLDWVEECSVGGINLLELIDGYERLLAIDSIRTEGGTPGACYYFTAEALRETVNLSNIHDTNFATALQLGRMLGRPIPADHAIHILAVEVHDTTTVTEQLSEPLRAAYPQIRATIFAHALRALALA